jgi:hypothetical protein
MKSTVIGNTAMTRQVVDHHDDPSGPRPERYSPCPGPPDSVGDISHHTATDLYVWEPRKHSARASLLPQYLDELC